MELYLALQALSAVLDSKATCSEMIIIGKGKMKGIFFRSIETGRKRTLNDIHVTD